MLLDNLNAGDDHLGNPFGNCSQFLELTNSPDALPLSALVEVVSPVGKYLPRNPFSNFHDNSNPNGTWELLIQDLKADNCGIFHRAEIVFEYADCLVPSQVLVQNVEKTSAEISWQNNGACDSIFIEWGERGFLPGTADDQGSGEGILKIACSAAQNLTLQNLQPFKFYDVFLRKKCAGGGFSPNSAAARIFTDCPPDLLENFDNQPVCSEIFNAACPISGTWMNILSDDNFDWKIRSGPAPSTPFTGPHTDADRKIGNYIYFETTNPNGGGWRDSTSILQSRCLLVDTSAGADCHFSFDFFMWRQSANATNTAKLEILLSQNDGQTWQILQTIEGAQPKRWQNGRISLAAWQGKIVQIRFRATAAANDFNDIALDNLRFYGTSDAGAADFKYFRDADGDGFGAAADSILSCSAAVPTGFVNNFLDCDDSNAAVPAAAEIFCNSTDDDCDAATADEILPVPQAADQTVCAGNPLTIKTLSQKIGEHFWFDKPTGGLPLAVGDSLFFQNFTQTKTFYLLDSLAGCASPRVEVVATALPSPFLTLDNPPAPICRGKSFDLASLVVFDVSGTAGDFSFHSALPASPQNRLVSSVVAPIFQTPYYIVKTTADGCASDLLVTLGVRDNPTASITSGDSMAICRNGLAKLTALGTGGNPAASGYNFEWSSAALPSKLFFKTIDIFGTAPGQTTIYSLVVSDQHGCSATDQIKVLTLNSVTNTQITEKQDVTTCGGGDGRISLNPLNGLPPFTYSWKTPQGIQSQTGSGVISNLKQGNYRFTITDNSSTGCSMVMPLIVLNAPGLSVKLDSLHNPKCPSGSDGSITLQVAGIAPTFVWSNNSTGQNLVGVPEKTYSVTITDGACQQILSNIELVAPLPISILENKNLPVRCFGGSDGEVEIQVAGGTPPYNFSWSNNSDFQNLKNAPAGNFSCVATDANGCQQQKNFQIEQPQKLEMQVLTIDSVRCFGQSNGSLRAFPAGGAGNFQFSWAHGANTALTNNLAAGTYFLTLTDKNGCTTAASANLEQPPILKFDSIFVQNPPCFGSKTGKIEPQISGGTPQYFFNWSNGSTAAALQNLDLGNFAVTVSDRRGCSISSQNLNIEAPQILKISLDTLRQIRCFGETNGAIGISVAGGRQPMAVRWNGFPDDFLIENLFAGQFTAVVTDADGCQNSASFEITAPAAPLQTALVNVQKPSCFGEFNGQIETKTLGGEAPFQFFWSNNSTTEDISELAAGSFQLTVSDSRGCSAVLPTVSLDQPPLLQTQVFPKNIPCKGFVGQIEIEPTGGTQPFDFQWSTGDTTQNIYQLPAGNFALTLTDANGCENKFDSLEIVDTNLDFAVAPVLKKDIACFGQSNGQVVVELSGGNPPFEFSWAHLAGVKISNAPRDTVFGLGIGTTSVFVRDAGQCEAFSQVFEIVEPSILKIDSIVVQNNLCKGAAAGCVSVFASGGTGDFSFFWNANDSLPTICDLPAGNFSVKISDENGCSTTATATVSEPQKSLEIVATSIFQDSCGNCNGQIAVQTNFGKPNYWYEWGDAATGQTNTNLCAGQFSVTSTDANGCSTTAIFEIESPADPLDIDSKIVDVLCAGDSSGSIEIAPFGGTAGYSLAWDDPDLQGNFVQNLSGGEYNLTVVDANFCQKIYAFQVFEPDPIQILDILKDSSAGGWNLDFKIVGGNDPYKIQIFDLNWNLVSLGGTGLATGWYHAVVTDSSGCFLKKEWIPVGTVAARQPDFLTEFEVFPNPILDFAWLRVLLLEASDLKIKVFEVTGGLVFSQNLEEKRADFLLPLDFSNLPSGVFFVKIQFENGQFAVRRVVK